MGLGVWLWGVELVLGLGFGLGSRTSLGLGFGLGSRIGFGAGNLV